MKANQYRILIALLFTLSLVACGNKGDLHMPDKNKVMPEKTK